jgi:hypothetical protein
MTAPLPVSPPFGFSGSRGQGTVLPPNIIAAGVGGVMARQLDVPLPEVYPIPDAKEFNILGSIASPGAQANILIAGTTFVIPTSNLAIIRGVSLYIAPMLITTNVTWSLTANGQPLPGYQNLSIFPRPAAQVTNSFDAFLRLRGEVTLGVIFTNTDGAAYTIGASYSGWFWPETSDQRWRERGE